MNLRELNENKKTTIVKRALKETYNMNIDFDGLSLSQTRKMLSKVKGLLSESRSNKSSNQNSSAYLKLVMMEQALQDHLKDIKQGGYRIVVENEEVEKSQVILAAQDMIDTIQKMLETVSKMNVEELFAVVDGIRNEFGANEADQFNESVGNTLKTLQDAIANARNGLTQSLGALTGEGGGEMPGMQAPSGEEMPPLGGEMGGEELPPPEAATSPAGEVGAGRAPR